MKRIAILTVFTLALTVIAARASQPVDFEKNWHHWRGPHATGVAVDANPPTTWSETENIRWKVAIPGTGHAAPIVWEDKIFIQTAIKGTHPRQKPKNQRMTIRSAVSLTNGVDKTQLKTLTNSILSPSIEMMAVFFGKRHCGS